MGKEYTSTVPEGQEADVNPVAGISFELDGETFSCEGHVKLLDQSDLALLAAEGRGDLRRPEAQASVAYYLRTVFGMAEYHRFKAHVDEHDTPNSVVLQILGDIVDEVQAAVEGLTGRPTEPALPSSPGQPGRDEQISRLMSLGAGDVVVMPGDHTAAEMAAERERRAGAAKPRGGKRASRSGNPAKRAAAGG